MNEGRSTKRNPNLTSLSHLEGLLYASLRLTKSGQEAVRLMQEAIGRLPMEYRLVLILSYLEGFPQEEIADLAGVEPQAVAAMLQRGRELIQSESVECAPQCGTPSMTAVRVSDAGTDWVNSRTEKSHACGGTECCRKHHSLTSE
jgi:hypothetical protein